MSPTLELVGPSATVLIVDDEESVVTVFERLLPRRGMKVQPAMSGEEALELLKTQKFGCVLVDKNLPGIDGIAVMREARRLQPYCACILMTAYASTSSAVEALRLGAMDYLEKPFDNLDLVVQKIEKAIRARRAEMERDAFLERIKSFEAELARQNEHVRQQRTDTELFNELVELRVRQATEDLQKKCEILEGCLHQSRDADYALLVHCESILDFVRNLHLDDAEPMAVARAALTRVERRLEAHLGLIRHMADEPEEAKKQPA